MADSPLEIQFDEEGDVNADQERQLHDALEQTGATDLLVFSHGWNNTPTVATQLYEAFFTRVKTLLELHGRSGRTVAYLGVYWPSIRWSDEPIPDFQPGKVVDLGAGTGGAAGGVGPPEVFKPPPPPDAELAALIQDAFPTAVHGQVDELLGLITDRPDDEAKLQRARELVAQIADAAGPDGDGEQADRPPFAAESDPKTRLFTDFTAALEELNVDTGTAGGAAGFGDAVGRLWHGAQEVLRGLTYWQMKNRAGVVGENGLGPLIGRLRQRHPDLGIDLIGHSFGARVVSYGLKGAPAQAVRSVTLLQGAFSHFAYATSLPFDADSAGALSGQRDNTSGPVTACYSRFDSAVGVMYPLASLLKGDDASAADEPLYRWGGMGHDGHQQGVEELALQQPGSHYDFTGKKLVNIDAQQVVREGRPPSGAHSDIIHDELAWVVLDAGGLV
ncbi:MAG TPA: serine-threonine protein kinase [Mycobacterium sp.]